MPGMRSWRAGGFAYGRFGHTGEVFLQSRIPRLAERRYRVTWWLVTRGFVLLMAVGMMFHHDWKHIFDDLNVYSRWGEGLAEGRVPSSDPMWQYPPLAAFVFGGIGMLGSQPWLFLLLFVAVDIAISLLLSRDAMRRDNWNGYAVWLAAPLLLGPILYGRYDSIPTLAAMAGLLALAVPVAAGAILAIGGGLKVWPAVMALALSRRAWLKGAFGAAMATGVVVVTAAWAFPGVISGFLGNGEARGLQTESVAALPFVWARMFVGKEGVPEAFRYGSSEVGVPLADAIAPWLIPLTGIGLLLLILARALGKLDHVPGRRHRVRGHPVADGHLAGPVPAVQRVAGRDGGAGLGGRIPADAHRDDPRRHHRDRRPGALPVLVHRHRRRWGHRGGGADGADRGPARDAWCWRCARSCPRSPSRLDEAAIARRRRDLLAHGDSDPRGLSTYPSPQHSTPEDPVNRTRTLAALAVAGLALAACSPASDTATEASASASGASCDKATLETKTPGKLVIATGQPAYEPWVKDDAPESGEGFEAAVAYAAAEKLGFDPADVQWARTTFDVAIAPGAKDFDWNIQQFSITEDREKAVDFSSSYYDVNQAIVSYEGSPIADAKTLADLESAKLGAAVGSTSLDAAQGLATGEEVAVFNDNAAAVSALKNEQIDGLVVDLPTAFYLVAAELDDGRHRRPAARRRGRHDRPVRDPAAQQQRTDGVHHPGRGRAPC